MARNYRDQWASLIKKLNADLSLLQLKTTPWFNYSAVDVLSMQNHLEYQSRPAKSVSNQRMKIPRFKLRRTADRPFNISYILYRNIPSEACEVVTDYAKQKPKYLKGKGIYLSKNKLAYKRFTSFPCQPKNMDFASTSEETFNSLLNVDPFLEELEDGYNLELELMAYLEKDSINTPKFTVSPPFDSSYLYDLVKQDQQNDK